MLTCPGDYGIGMTFQKTLKCGNAARALLFGLMFLLSACGYRFSGGGSLPAHVTRVSIPVFENRTSEAGLESSFANDLMDEFTRARIPVTTGNESADASLMGVIRTLSVETISHGSHASSLEKRVTVSVDIKLVSKTGEVLREYRGLSESEAFDVAEGERFATDQNQRNAISTISKRLSETIYKMLTDDF